eukprot:TRINITY_DN13410_c0_g1_i1.p1 TRINITY_DN13410_c0_g1~~TRINITY_DN13410_c0_g1_i1.p1  ORF type:complete len:648 (+),score=161.85 TRINITY_DN13410_c0_g1_i1:57-2000(+)
MDASSYSKMQDLEISSDEETPVCALSFTGLCKVPTVTLKNGSKLKGKVQSNGVRIFKNIPYAEAPIGKLRFAPPQEKKAWSGVLDCSGKEGPVAMQLGISVPLFVDIFIKRSGFAAINTWLLRKLMKFMPITPGTEDESCLNLRIVAPPRGGELKPVMVWIHGGDHQDGSPIDDPYMGDALAKMGMVVVYIGYRLNVFGYFAHPELSAETPRGEIPWGGDAGVRDQIHALKWVQGNIAGFGGDPNNVTIFGESAGGESVAHLMCTPASAGLFHKAIAQSPSCVGKHLHRKQSMGPIRSAEDQGVSFATSAVGPAPGQLERLRMLPATELLRLYKEWNLNEAAKPDGDNGFSVVVGSKRYPAMIPESHYNIFSQGKQHQVPLIIGTNANEGSILGEFIADIVPARTVNFLNPMPCGEAASAQKAYTPQTAQRLQQLYPGLDGSGGDEQKSKAEEDIMGDLMFSRYAYMLATLHSSVQPTYYYEFQRQPQVANQSVGAAHTSELFFVHGTASPADSFDAVDLALGEAMRSYWTGFASTGNPNVEGLSEWEELNNARPEWMEFDRNSIAMGPVSKKAKFEALLEPLRVQLFAFEDQQVRASLFKAWCITKDEEGATGADKMADPEMRSIASRPTLMNAAYNATTASSGAS